LRRRTWHEQYVMPGAIAAIGSALKERLFPPPLDSVEALGRFVGQRSAFVAQTSLFGYLQTRMGTSFPRYFEDESFAASIKASAVRLFASCASDLTIHAVSVAGQGGRLDAAASAELARHVYRAALRTGVDAADAWLLPADAAAAFDARAARTVWPAAVTGDAAFSGSIADLVRFAPVIDEYKRLDGAIVRNSIRLRWREVRQQLQRRLDAEAVSADWQIGWPQGS
jgi:hypothetical protein